MTQFFNKTIEKEKRRQLRNNAPPAEAIVWSKLKGKRLLEYNFRRQYSVGPYVIDFYCPALKLAVEIDGNSHFEEGAKDGDYSRQAFIESFGIQFLRFTNEEVHNNLEGVLAAIAEVIQQRKTPCSPPLPRGDR
jgi:very-short-patch-repair endonuclease